ncbi:MAG: hypothetical protein EP334_09390 [Gammaproteobacteria bacterium]|nr:MAG: hypothetical protein EP334_09390 [Gammaproteobacteria bacterium]
MYRINPQVITMIQGELEKEVLSLMQLLEDAAETVDIAAFNEHLQSLCGALKVLELPSAVTLLDTVTAISADPAQLALSSRGYKVIYSSLQCLKAYLQQLPYIQQDNLLLLLPEINELRAVLSLPPLDERVAVAEFTPEKLPLEEVELRRDDERDVVRSVRRLFQQGLVHALKGANRQAAVKVMAHGVHRLRKVLTAPAERDYWSLVFEILSAMHRGTLGFEQSRLKTLMSVERQLRAMEENQDQSKFYPLETQQLLLAYFSLSGLQGDGAKKLAERLGVRSPGFTSKDVITSRDMFSGDGDKPLNVLVATIAEQVEQLRQHLDEVMTPDAIDGEECQELAAGFRMLGEFCTQCNLRLASQRCEAHVAGIDRLQGGHLPMPLYEQLADTLLYLDSVLNDLQSRAVSESQIVQINARSLKQVVEDNIVEHAERRALQEATEHLSVVMQMTSDYCDGIAGDEVAEPLVENFKQILGPMDMLGLRRAEGVARRCLEILNRCLHSGGSISLASTMEVFADAIVSLEYYLQNRRWNRNFDDAVLSVAEECLASLEAA